jgi:hypothetical protein
MVGLDLKVHTNTLGGYCIPTSCIAMHGYDTLTITTCFYTNTMHITGLELKPGYPDTL